MTASRLVVLALAGLLLVLGGCRDRRSWRADEADIVAWWVEDVAHGHPRRAEELQLVGGSERMARVAEWAGGSEIRGSRSYPPLLDARRQRRALLTGLCRQGLIVLTPAGLLAPRPGLDPTEARLVEPAVDSENLSRRQLDSLLVQMADARPAAAEAYLAAVKAARLDLDARDGARLWTGDGARGGATPAR